MPMPAPVSAITWTFVHTVMTSGSARRATTLVLLSGSLEPNGVGDIAQHLDDRWIVSRAAVHVPIDRPEPSFQVSLGKLSTRFRRDDHQVHLGCRAPPGHRQNIVPL